MLDSEQTVVTTPENTTDNQVQENNTVENKVEEVEQKPFKVFDTEEALNKELQSARSKAKYELLQELGIANVDEFKSLKCTYDSAIKDKEELLAKYKELEDAHNKTKQDYELDKIGVKADKKEDFLLLAKSRMTEKDTLTSISEKLKEEYPSLFEALKETTPTIGSERRVYVVENKPKYTGKW